MDFGAHFDRELDAHEAAVRASRPAVRGPFVRLCEICIAALKGGNKLLLFGNGGSAADAQHIAAELVIRYRMDRAPLAALALTTDSSALTAGANDLGYDNIFARQLGALGRAGDVAIGISTSGNSENVVRALELARGMSIVPAAFSGRDGGRLQGLADPLLVVPDPSVARIQEMHIALGHMLCDVIERECGT